MTKCPACAQSEHPGYNGLVRCEVCKGAGVATIVAIMGWEASLVPGPLTC